MNHNTLTKNISWPILFSMEVYVIVLFFYSLPDNPLAMAFWIAAAIVVTLIHLFCLIELKSNYAIKKWSSVWFYIIAYALLLIGFAFSSLAYNLKVTQGKVQVNKYSNLKDSLTINQIANDSNTINTYQAYVNPTNTQWTILKYRGLINGLESNEMVLINSLPTNEESSKVDSFQMIADTFGWDRNKFMTFFLWWVWAVCELGLFLTCPIILPKKQEPIKRQRRARQNKPVIAPQIVPDDKTPEPAIDNERSIARNDTKQPFNVNDFIRDNKQKLLSFITGGIEGDRLKPDDYLLSLNFSRQDIADCKQALENLEAGGSNILTGDKITVDKESLLEFIKRG